MCFIVLFLIGVFVSLDKLFFVLGLSVCVCSTVNVFFICNFFCTIMTPEFDNRAVGSMALKKKRMTL